MTTLRYSYRNGFSMAPCLALGTVQTRPACFISLCASRKSTEQLCKQSSAMDDLLDIDR